MRGCSVFGTPLLWLLLGHFRGFTQSPKKAMLFDKYPLCLVWRGSGLPDFAKYAWDGSKRSSTGKVNDRFVPYTDKRSGGAKPFPASVPAERLRHGWPGQAKLWRVINDY